MIRYRSFLLLFNEKQPPFILPRHYEAIPLIVGGWEGREKREKTPLFGDVKRRTGCDNVQEGRRCIRYNIYSTRTVGKVYYTERDSYAETM